jgi:hypothetical protein
MPKSGEIDTSPADEFLAQILRVMRENERFMRLNAPEAYGEIIALANDAIEYLPDARRGATIEGLVRSSISYFVNHVLMPLGGAMYIDLLSGSLPACFTQLRTALESLAKSWLADAKYPEMDFFRDKLFELEEAARQNSLSITKLMEEFDIRLGFDKRSVALWGKLSQDWVHPRGIMERTLAQINQKSDLPPWALVIPMNYTVNDLESLQELQKRVGDFRAILVAALQNGTHV